MSRADSALMMKEARNLRAVLYHGGVPEKELPKLIGNAGHAWFLWWRKTHGIVRKVSGMKLKVPWAKVKRRIEIWLTNLFRLKALWELCHPGKPMRFLSLDQKPSWFNNAGLTGALAVKGSRAPSVKENHAKTRERYTILTAVPSWGHDPHCPPKMCLLFKGADDGTIRRTLEKFPRLLPWTKIQTQENGSYRSGDMVEALAWMLPDAQDSSESIVVLLDWYSGHLTDEVREIIHRKGHVLAFHGGGCTPYTQVNDTHLHATLARHLLALEVDWSRDELEEKRDRGESRFPTVKRETIIDFVQTAWQQIDHARVAAKGYAQTGPTMPHIRPCAAGRCIPRLTRRPGQNHPRRRKRSGPPARRHAPHPR